MLAAKKFFLISQRTARPFSRSGGWDGLTDEGWVKGSGVFFSGNSPRSSPYCYAYDLGPGEASAEYLIQGKDCYGLNITAYIWFRGDRSTGGSANRVFYKIGSGSFVPLGPNVNLTAAYQRYGGTFLNSGGKNTNVTIRIDLSAASMLADDWSIAGARP